MSEKLPISAAEAAWEPGASVDAEPGDGLAEAEELWWRPAKDRRFLRRYEWAWTLWTAGVLVTFVTPAFVLIALEPLLFPVAAICLAHAWLIPMLSARRGWRQVVPIGDDRSAAARGGSSPEAERVALGLLGDLLGHEQRDLALQTGLAMHHGDLGVWLVGEQGALLVRAGGRRVDCWCVRIANAGELPSGDRVAHLLLALREDEQGFATVANLGFSGAAWRVLRHAPRRSRPALLAARSALRGS